MTPPIHQKTRSRWALLLVLPILAGCAIYFFAGRVRTENNWVRHSRLVQLSLERMLFDLENAETSQRGYLLTGEERFFTSYREAAPRVLQEVAILRQLTADNSRQQGAVVRLEQLVQRKLIHMEASAGLRRAGKLTGAGLDLRVEQGRVLMDAVQSEAAALREEEEQLLRERELTFEKDADRFTWSLGAGCLLMIVLAGSLYAATGRYSRQAADAEQRLARLNSELEQRVRERTSSLQAREDLLQTFVKHVPAAVAMLDREMRYLQVSDRWCLDYGLAGEPLLGRSHYEVFPDLPERWKEIHRRCLAGETLRAEEDCWDRAGGSRTWLHWEIRPWGQSAGQPQGVLIFSEDITGRKRMEEALRESERELRAFAASLLTAQEDERRRIARELHDDVTQRLAFLSIEIGKLAGAEAAPAETIAGLRSMQNQIIQISEEVRRLSHGLHPAVIEDFGLSTALEEFCEDFSQAQTVPIHFEGLVEDGALSFDAASCLYRVAQEGVRNAAKHAGATEVRVELRKTGDCIELSVIDNGAGFTPDAARAASGLGITSMNERMRLVDGWLAIHSQPGQGTRVEAGVPLSGERREKTANLVG